MLMQKEVFVCSANSLVNSLYINESLRRRIQSGPELLVPCFKPSMYLITSMQLWLVGSQQQNGIQVLCFFFSSALLETRVGYQTASQNKRQKGALKWDILKNLLSVILSPPCIFNACSVLFFDEHPKSCV